MCPLLNLNKLYSLYIEKELVLESSFNILEYESGEVVALYLEDDSEKIYFKFAFKNVIKIN